MQFYFSSNCFIFTLLASIVIKDIFSWVRENHSINRVLIWKHAVVYKSFCFIYLPFSVFVVVVDFSSVFFLLFYLQHLSCRCFCIQVSWWKHFLRHRRTRRTHFGNRDKNDRMEETKKIYFTGKCFIVIFELCTHKNGLKTGSYVIIYGCWWCVFQKLSVKSGMEWMLQSHTHKLQLPGRDVKARAKYIVGDGLAQRSLFCWYNLMS